MKTIAVSEMTKRSRYESHMGVVGIAIRGGFRGMGIGTEMMKRLTFQATTMGLRVLALTAFATNRCAPHVYEEPRFVQTGRIPKKRFKEGKYVD